MPNPTMAIIKNGTAPMWASSAAPAIKNIRTKQNKQYTGITNLFRISFPAPYLKAVTQIFGCIPSAMADTRLFAQISSYKQKLHMRSDSCRIIEVDGTKTAKTARHVPAQTTWEFDLDAVQQKTWDFRRFTAPDGTGQSKRDAEHD